jgi:hypothetical protein
VEPHLRAGAAVFHAGHTHAAHDAWEDRWLELEEGTADELLLHGLIQYTAVVHHAGRGNWTGAEGLARSGLEYLEGVPAGHRGVDLAPIETFLGRVAADPEHAERTAPPDIRIGEEVPVLTDLDPEAALIAATPLLEALDHEEAIEGVAYARADLEAGDEESRFLRLALDLVTDPAHRETAIARLTALADRRRQREEDVEDLF